jgi:PKHD-type hydroxylase
MLLTTIADFVTPEEAAALRSAFNSNPMADGQNTAAWEARRVKRNQEMQRADDSENLDRIVAEAIRRSARFWLVALPKATSRPIYSRYAPDMAYGPHVDDAIMHPHHAPLRADIAVTVFLTQPTDYDGGELSIQYSPVHSQRAKLPAGAAVIYPANTVHRVEPVTRGERLAVVFWVQSLVRGANQRELLFDLHRLRHNRGQPESIEEDKLVLAKTYNNLLRLWSEP